MRIGTTLLIGLGCRQSPLKLNEKLGIGIATRPLQVWPKMSRESDCNITGILWRSLELSKSNLSMRKKMVTMLPADINAHIYDDDEEEEDDDEEEVPITLGFVETPKNQWSLLPHLFPSKAGGFPAWLEPINLPSRRNSICGICGEPLQFLLQLSHANPFYSSEPPRHDGTDKPSDVGVAALCSWCGTWKGDKVCSGCRRARYCTEEHQAIHWRSGHKIDCRQLSIASQTSDSSSSKSSAETKKVASHTLWPRYEIVNEGESEVDIEMSANNGYANALVSGSRVDKGIKSLLDSFVVWVLLPNIVKSKWMWLNYANLFSWLVNTKQGDGDKKSWATFQERISRVPELVLRYCSYARARPLWPMSSGQPLKADIPKCSYCSGLRSFEFQVTDFTAAT